MKLEASGVWSKFRGCVWGVGPDRWAALAVGSALALALGCGGSAAEPVTPANDSPEDLLADEPEGAEQASSAEVQKGIDAIAAEDFAGAKALLSKAVATDPKDAQAVFYLGVAETGLGENDAAIGHWRTALELDPKLAEAALNLSALLLDQEKFDEALAAAEKGLAAAPNDTGLLQNKAMALLMTGKEAAAAPLFGKVVAQKPDDEGLRFMYAQALLAAGNSDEAKTQLDTLAGSKDVAVLASVADLFGRLKTWGGCIKALDGAIAQQSAAELFVKRGLCKHGKKDEDGAKADFEKAIEIEPSSIEGHFYLGHNKKARGDKKGAKAAFKKAAELDPDGKMGKAAKAQL
jgi:Tfp pilus assembly protein PilF